MVEANHRAGLAYEDPEDLAVQATVLADVGLEDMVDLNHHFAVEDPASGDLAFLNPAFGGSAFGDLAFEGSEVEDLAS